MNSTPNSNSKRNIHFGRPWITDEDREAVLDVLNGPILTHGPQTLNFEREFGEYVGNESYSVALSSCTAALHLAYLQMNLPSNAEVIVPAMTHTATAHAVELAGARPVFVDCDIRTGNIGVEQIEAALTPRTKAISVVHFLGIPCEMDAIASLAKQHSLKLIEDCALAVGTYYKDRHAGTWGDAGCFSFYPVKHITTGDGGMFISHNEQTAAEVATLRGFGVDRTHTQRSIPGIYDVVALGLNYRMSEMQAALGRQQLLKVPEILKRREANFALLKALIQDAGDISILDVVDRDSINSYYCLTVILKGALAEKRNEIVSALNQSGVGTSVYYPHPVPRLNYYRNKYGYEAKVYPNSSSISDNSIALPVGPHVSEEDVHYMAAQFKHSLR